MPIKGVFLFFHDVFFSRSLAQRGSPDPAPGMTAGLHLSTLCLGEMAAGAERVYKRSRKRKINTTKPCAKLSMGSAELI